MPIFVEKKPDKLISEDGTRIDGRKPDELRPIEIKVGVLERADGSAYVKWGGNRILVAVYGPRAAHPRHQAIPHEALVRCRYDMAPFSPSTDRKKPGPDRRSIELSTVIEEALKPVIFKEMFGGTAIDIFVEVLRSDAGTRVAGITGASVALADAGIPIRGLVTGCSVGKVGDFIVLDPGHEEDMWGDGDMPVAFFMETGEVTLLQADGQYTYDEFQRALKLAYEGCKQVYELQKKAIIEKYEKLKLEGEIDEQENS